MSPSPRRGPTARRRAPPPLARVSAAPAGLASCPAVYYYPPRPPWVPSQVPMGVPASQVPMGVPDAAPKPAALLPQAPRHSRPAPCFTHPSAALSPAALSDDRRRAVPPPQMNIVATPGGAATVNELNAWLQAYNEAYASLDAPRWLAALAPGLVTSHSGDGRGGEVRRLGTGVATARLPVALTPPAPLPVLRARPRSSSTAASARRSPRASRPPRSSRRPPSARSRRAASSSRRRSSRRRAASTASSRCT